MNKKIFQNIFKNKKGGTMLMLTILILSSILTISLVSADVVINSLKASRIQNYSTKAFFAAEAGAERALFEIRKERILDTINCVDTERFCFDAISNGEINECTAAGSCPNEEKQVLVGNGAEYQIDYYKSGQLTTLVSSGVYGDTKRVVEVSYCTPDCTAKNCGDTDGCDGTCPPTCSTQIGCQLAAPANAVITEPGSCCTGDCYECDSANGFGWNGSACVDNTYCGDGIVQEPNSTGITEICDGTSPLGGNQECSLDCLAIGYGFYMENNTSIDMDNAYFTATNNDERYVSIHCNSGVIDIYGVCEQGIIECHTGAENTADCEIGCDAYDIPGNQSYYQFVCR
jgi:hypothetical protein